LIPLVLVLVVVVIQPRWTDFLLVLTKLVYAVLLMQLARQAPQSLQLVRLHWISNTQQALWGAVTLLLLSVGLDIAIAIDFALNDGRHAASMVGIANLATVCLLGWASVMAGRSIGADAQTTSSTYSSTAKEPPVAEPVGELEESSAVNTVDESAQLIQQLNHLLIEQRLFADSELNLQKLARKAGVPARAVSSAINKQTGKNVSQWVNAARVDAVCDLLLDKKMSVTQAMHDVGFITKSNFNREFRRLKGCSPSQWRAEH